MEFKTFHHLALPYLLVSLVLASHDHSRHLLVLLASV